MSHNQKNVHKVRAILPLARCTVIIVTIVTAGVYAAGPVFFSPSTSVDREALRAGLNPQATRGSAEVSRPTTLADVIGAIRGKAATLENSAGMRSSFRSFAAANKIPLESVSYSDYAVVRLLYEATRDAGFWNLHWTITNEEPNSDKIWRQWRTAGPPSAVTATASAECDELSALYAFLAGRAGVKGIGLFGLSRITRLRSGLCVRRNGP